MPTIKKKTIKYDLKLRYIVRHSSCHKCTKCQCPRCFSSWDNHTKRNQHFQLHYWNTSGCCGCTDCSVLELNGLIVHLQQPLLSLLATWVDGQAHFSVPPAAGQVMAPGTHSSDEPAVQSPPISVSVKKTTCLLFRIIDVVSWIPFRSMRQNRFSGKLSRFYNSRRTLYSARIWDFVSPDTWWWFPFTAVVEYLAAN